MFDRLRIVRSEVLAAIIALSAVLSASGKGPAFVEFFGLNLIDSAITNPFFTTVAWTSTGSSTTWYTSTNWTPNTALGQWMTTDIAQFNDAGSTITAGINMNTASLSIGAIDVMSVRTRPLTIGNSAPTPSTGTLTLNGAMVKGHPNVILRNASSSLLTLQNNETSSGRTMNVALANPQDNLILMDGGGGITISSSIGGSGKNLTLAGAGGGVFRLSASNTYSGTTTIKSGAIFELVGAGSVANSTVIELDGGGAFDVQSLDPANPFVLGNVQALRASGSGTTGIIATTANRGFTTSAGSSIIFSAFNGGATAPLTISGSGGMNLQAANPVTITVSQGGAALNAGSYKLIAKRSNGFVTGTPTVLTVNGDGVCSGCSSTLVLINGELFLNVAAAGTPTLTPTDTPTATASSTAASTSTSTSTATETPTSTSTPTATATGTFTATATETATATGTFTTTPTATSTSTSTPTPVNRPSVTTDPATNVTSTSVQLNGSADPNGEPTFAHFRYSLNHPGICDDGFGTRLPDLSASDVSLGAGGGAIPFAFNATGLSPGATYYFCAIASNGFTTGYGAVLSVTAAPTEPAVTTGDATLITGTEAQFNGAANPNGGGAVGWFRYAAADPGACSDNFGTRAPASGAAFLGSGTSPVGYSHGVTGLTPGTTYYYCAIALNNIGFAFGPLVTFTTPLPPTVTTLAVTDVTGTTALLNGSANPNAALTAGWFRYSTTDPVTCDDAFGTRVPLSGGVSLGSGTSVQAYSQPIAGLLADTRYYFSAIAANHQGTIFGSVLSFTATNSTPSPTPTTTETSTPTATATATNTFTSTPTETATATFTPTATPTNIASATPTVTPVVLAVSLPAVSSAPGSNLTLPITVGDTTGLDIFSYDLQITYDPAVVTPMIPPFDVSGTLSSGMVLTSSNDVQGHLIISAFQATPLADPGTLLRLNFTVSGLPEQSTTLAFADYTDPGNIVHFGFRFNDGVPTAATVNGSVTVLPTGTVSGTVAYGNATGAPAPRYVSNVTITAAGSPSLVTTTAAAGQYSLMGFGAGAYTVTPSKTGGVNGITSFDAALVARHAAGSALLSGNQLIAADVSNNGVVSSFDAAQIARFATASPPFGITGTWKFIPASRSYSSVAGDVVGEDFAALLMGDVSGNWASTAARPANGVDPTALSWLMTGGF